MPELLIRIKKKSDGSAALSCLRADGSVTWQRQEGVQGRFFPIHDLTHYAVETVLGHRRGFYGLVAEGWDLSDFGAPWPKGRLPADLDPSELLVGFLDSERAGAVTWSADDFNAKTAIYYAQQGRSGSCRISPGQLERVRAMRDELIARWRALPAGATLELPFERAESAA
ncbi:MAG TPA: hypothetical protein VIP80_12545 [Gemmatimonadales bacterium]|jgi:hypothetical protein